MHRKQGVLQKIKPPVTSRACNVSKEISVPKVEESTNESKSEEGKETGAKPEEVAKEGGLEAITGAVIGAFGKGNPYVGFIILVSIVVAGIFVYRRFKPNSKQIQQSHQHYPIYP